MYKKIKPENLSVYLGKIDRLFPEFCSDSSIDAADIEQYYQESYWGYAIFHSWSGAIHMAMSPDGRFSRSDYFRQAEEIGLTIAELRPDSPVSVLEVGCGRGFNSRYLAEAFPNYTFLGVDISEKNLNAAKRDHSQQENLSFRKADFQDLSDIPDASIDVVFAVETLCHATHLDLAAKGIGRILREGGRLIVFDGFRGPAFKSSESMTRAVAYAERAMAVPEFKEVNDFVKTLEVGQLLCEVCEDRSEEIMPNLVRLSDFAKGFFKINFMSRLILRVLPRGLVANSVAGLLMAVTVQEHAHRYMKLIFKKVSIRIP